MIQQVKVSDWLGGGLGFPLGDRWAGAPKLKAEKHYRLQRLLNSPMMCADQPQHWIQCCIYLQSLSTA